MPDNRRNLQVRQDGIQGYDVDDKNGWPTPLCDPSNPVKMAVTNGSSGEQKNFDPTSTSKQDVPEAGITGKYLHTDQQKSGDHSTP